VALRRANFAFIEVCEILLRYYKAVSDRLRPTDRMVAHTGYLIFSRSVVAEVATFESPEQMLEDHRELNQPEDRS
jgi:tRNA (adenine57-N1/adenine58-N1)-methyltransferase